MDHKLVTKKFNRNKKHPGFIKMYCCLHPKTDDEDQLDLDQTVCLEPVNEVSVSDHTRPTSYAHC